MSDFAVPQEMRLEDAPAATAETQQQSPKTSREEAMAAIYGKRDLQIREELEQGATDEAERAAAAEDRETARARTELAQRAQTGTETRGQPQLRTVTIDGSPMQVTEAQDRAARPRWDAGPPDRGAIPAAGRLSATAVARAPDPAPTIEPGEAAELARRIQYGDTDEVAHAVQHLAQRIAARQPQIDPRAIVQAATQQMLQTQELNHNLHTIGTEFPDIFNDRTLSQLAAPETRRVAPARCSARPIASGSGLISRGVPDGAGRVGSS